MERCPPELHAYITQFACTDDGYTIRSLYGVSRYYREISRPYLYQALSISHVHQIPIIAAQLEALPIHWRHIRHLLISNECSNASLDQIPHSSNSPPLSLLEIQTLVLRIITIASPTLFTLAFVASSSSPAASTPLIARIFRTPFPLLHDLTICGYYPFPNAPGKFPCLERLHLSGNRNPHGLFQLGVLEAAFPSLRDLKVDGLGMAVTFLFEVEEALSGGAKDESLFPATLPHHLRKLRLRAGPEPVVKVVGGRKVGNEDIKDRVMVQRLEALGKTNSVDVDEVKVEVLERSAERICLDEIRQAWLESITGLQA